MQHRNTIPQIKKLGSSESQAGLRGPPTFLVSFMVLSGWSFPFCRIGNPVDWKDGTRNIGERRAELVGCCFPPGVSITFWTHQKGEGENQWKIKSTFLGGDMCSFLSIGPKRVHVFFLKWECTSLKTNMDPGYICIYTQNDGFGKGGLRLKIWPFWVSIC